MCVYVALFLYHTFSKKSHNYEIAPYTVVKTQKVCAIPLNQIIERKIKVKGMQYDLLGNAWWQVKGSTARVGMEPLSKTSLRWMSNKCWFQFVFFNIFPFEGILAFWPPGLGSYWMRLTASYFFEGLVAMAKIYYKLHIDTLEPWCPTYKEVQEGLNLQVVWNVNEESVFGFCFYLKECGSF